MNTFFLVNRCCILTWWAEREKERENERERERASSLVSSCKGTNPIRGALSSWPHLNLITSQRSHFLISSNWRLGLQYVNLGICKYLVCSNNLGKNSFGRMRLAEALQQAEELMGVKRVYWEEYSRGWFQKKGKKQCLVRLFFKEPCSPREIGKMQQFLARAVLTRCPSNRHYCLHFTDEEAETQKD